MRVRKDFWEYVQKTDTCWLWNGGKLRNGYGVLFSGELTENGKRKRIMAHRKSYLLHHGELPSDKLVCHKCDVRNCVRPSHLFLGTYADNNADMRAKGRHAYGCRSPLSKLNPHKVRRIRHLAKSQSDASIGLLFGVSRKTISKVRNRITWKSIVEQDETDGRRTK